MDKITSFRDLICWQVAKDLTLLVYKKTDRFPKSEIFSLINQMRRAAISVASNIAEGFSRKSKAEKLQFYSMAKGSLIELQSQFIIAKEIGYLGEVDFQEADTLIERCGRLIVGLSRSV